MRKAQKERIKRLAETLRQAHLEIKSALESQKTNVAMELFGQCQEAAVQMGNFIEALEGEGFATISLLEEYCEMLFRFYERIGEKQGTHADKIYKTLNKMQVRISNSIKNDIRIHREVVFLPYKASMWDALESVWLAAREDPDCDAYVIPIPYYDRNPDGSFGRMHYEGELYPDYVPVVPYDTYNFAERRPDMVFIHNPYDDCNYVTSVHPYFYSGNLRKFTEFLVYIPYFILHEVNPDNEAAIEDVKHFCTTPGVVNADKVIVQSENMRKIYINVMAEYAKGVYEKSYWKRKILGLGSPKTDKIVVTQKEDLELPDEWTRHIRKPDGTWKTIILYNTSVAALLKHEERMLEKMTGVFRFFRERTSEMALLWRPHPLIMETIESMRPGLRETYEKLRESYIKENFGIYDDSSDMDRALILSDAYYGDKSSLVQLYKRLGKPIMIQNVEIKHRFREGEAS